MSSMLIKSLLGYVKGKNVIVLNICERCAHKLDGFGYVRIAKINGEIIALM